MKTENPLISVIVPSYNYAHYLPDLINSLQRQSYSNWECIIVDDNSMDNTKEVVNSFMEKDIRIKYYFQENGGPAKARNYGISIAKGDYIQFIDADDFIGDEKFQLEIELFNKNNSIDIVYSSYTFVDSDLKKQWRDEKKWESLSSKPFYNFINYWEAGLMIPIHSFLFKKECFSHFGSLDLNFKTHEDWDLNLNFSLNGAKYVMHNYIGAYYRVHQSSSSRTDLTGNRKDTMNILAKYKSKTKFFSIPYLLIVNRYFEFFADFIIESIVHKRIKFIQVNNNDMGGAFNILALLLSPFYLFKRIVRKILK